MIVYVVVCLSGHDDPVYHIFSTGELAKAYAFADKKRSHVLYDYELDNPARHEEPPPLMN